MNHHNSKINDHNSKINDHNFKINDHNFKINDHNSKISQHNFKANPYTVTSKWASTTTLLFIFAIICYEICYFNTDSFQFAEDIWLPI